MKKMATIVFLFSLLFFLSSHVLVHSDVVETWCQENSEAGSCNGNSCCLDTGGGYTCICSLDTSTWEHSCHNYGDVAVCNSE